jgi:ParB-like chromosome segregation protein Spo0J
MKSVKIAFEPKVITLSVERILPVRQITENIRQSVKYRRIAQSMREVGIIEPIIVAQSLKGSEDHLLLDGHIRFDILRSVGEKEVKCIIAADDEAFTYNKRINRLATVQEHYMVMRAIERGVPEERLAKALGMNLSAIKRRRTLLDGICPEVVELFKEKSVNPGTFDALRKMKPMRQMEAAELMVTAGNFSASYAKALLIATKQNDLARPERPKRITGMTAEQIARLELEMEGLQQEFKHVESTYGEDVLHLVIASGYLSKVLRSRKVERYLTANYPEFIPEFRAIIASASLDQQAPPMVQ